MPIGRLAMKSSCGDLLLVCCKRMHTASGSGGGCRAAQVQTCSGQPAQVSRPPSGLDIAARGWRGRLATRTSIACDGEQDLPPAISTQLGRSDGNQTPRRKLAELRFHVLVYLQPAADPSAGAAVRRRPIDHGHRL